MFLKLTKRLDGYLSRIQAKLPDPTDDSLDAANQVAVAYLPKHVISSMLRFGVPRPLCFEHSIYTYAAFLNVASEQRERDVRLCLGCAGRGNKSGLHAFLMDKNKIYDALPINRTADVDYVSAMDFQITSNGANLNIHPGLDGNVKPHRYVAGILIYCQIPRFIL